VHVTCLCLQLIDIDGAALLEQRKALQQAHGVDVLVYAADVCDNSAVERAVREHAARWGGLPGWLSFGRVGLKALLGERGDYMDTSVSTAALTGCRAYAVGCAYAGFAA
jgi:NAD(P)-dependent dehydrogenase (short-subunit alcohol dehydrogenase family)